MNILSFAPLETTPDEIIKKFWFKSFKIPFAVELLYMPYLFFEYRIELTPFFGRPKSEKGFFLVDLLLGTPMNIQKNISFEMSDDLKKEFEGFGDLFYAPKNDRDKKKVKLQKKEAEESQILPILLKEKDAQEKGKKLLRYDIMRVAGALRYRKMDIVCQPKTIILHYPYWVVYYRDRRKMMRFDAFDGLSGAKERGEIFQCLKLGLTKKGEVRENGQTEIQPRP